MRLNRKMRRAGVPEIGSDYRTDRSTEIRRVVGFDTEDADRHGEDGSVRVSDAYVIRYTIPALGTDEYEIDLGTWKREGWVWRGGRA